MTKNHILADVDMIIQRINWYDIIELQNHHLEEVEVVHWVREMQHDGKLFASLFLWTISIVFFTMIVPVK